MTTQKTETTKTKGGQIICSILSFFRIFFFLPQEQNFQNQGPSFKPFFAEINFAKFSGKIYIFASTLRYVLLGITLVFFE